MTRDPKLIKVVLEYIGQNATDDRTFIPLLPGYERGAIGYHILLCHQAGFLSARDEAGGSATPGTSTT